MAIVTNVTRMLEVKKISFTVYETPTEKMGAVETARYLNISPEMVYKTVVVMRRLPEGILSTKKVRPVLAVVPGTCTVDLKMLANVLGEKKMFLPTEKEAEHLTGLQAGGISPLALINKGFQVILDKAAQAYESIHISGGQRGLNILLPVNALVDLTHARLENISRPEE